MTSQRARLGRTIGLLLAGLVLWGAAVGLVAQAASPSLIIQPASGPLGTVFRLRAADLPPTTDVQATVYAPGGAAAPAQSLTADATGRLALAWLSHAGDALGVYTAALSVAGTPIVSGTFTVTAATAPSLAVFPFAGSAATTFTFLGAGFAASQPVELALSRPDGELLTLVVTTTPAGGLDVPLPAVGLPGGAYLLTARVAGLPAAHAQFRIDPLPATCRALVSNGGFEERPDFLGWNRAGDPFVADQGAFSGARVAVLGGYNNALDAVTQTLNIPASAAFARLSYWRARVPEDNPGADVMRVSLSRPDGELLQTVETVEPTSAADVWERVVTNMPYSGQAVRLAFAAATDAAQATAYGVDEVAAVSCATPPTVDIGPPVMTLRPVPSAPSVPPGAIVRVDVWVENVAGLYGVDATLRFDPTLLRPRTAQTSLGPFLYVPGHALASRNTVDATAGIAQVTVTRLAPTPPISGSGILFSLDFDALKEGTATLTVTNALAAAQGGTAIPVETASGALTIRLPSPSVTGRVVAQGAPDSAGTVIHVTGATTTSVTTNTSGDFRLEGLAPGAHHLLARRPGWLCAQREVTVAAGQALTVPAARLLAGDVNRSDSVDLFDLVRIAFLYDSPATVDPAADLNGSGIIDIGDLVLVALNYGTDCPQPWTAASKARAATLRGTPRLSVVSSIETEDGLRLVEVWADGAAGAQGLDLTLRLDATRARVVGETPFRLGRAFDGAFVARNEARDGALRLAVSLLAANGAPAGRFHVATLTVKGDPAALRIERATWADSESRAVSGLGPAASGTPTTRQSEPLVKAATAPEMRWTRPAVDLKR